MTTYLWIALGSALGGVARYWSSGFVAAHVGETFPFGTLAVNVIGSFVIGFFAAFVVVNSAVLLLAATWLIATLSTPDPSGAQFPGVTYRATIDDYGFVLFRNRLGPEHCRALVGALKALA